MAKHEIEKILEAAENTPWVPLGFIGSPGNGKTQIVEDYAQKKGLALVKLLASSMDECDVSGIVVSTAHKALAQDEEGRLRIVPGVDGGAKTLSPEWLKKLQTGGILLLDELNAARREVQDSLLTLIQSRTMPNGDRLHPGVRVIACMNDFIQCGNYCMSPAMRNRFAWFKVRTTPKQWLRWLKEEVHQDVFAFMNVAFQRGMVFSDEKAFMDDGVNLFTTPRSLYNLIAFSGGLDKGCDGTKIVSAMAKFCVNFVDSAAQGVLRAIGVEAKKDRSNAIFQAYLDDRSIDNSAVKEITEAVRMDNVDDDEDDDDF